MNKDGGINHMIIKLWDDKGILDQVTDRVLELGWSQDDEIVVKLAGTRTSGLQASDTANPRWHPKPGAVVHNTDCQIIIENVSRRDQSKSSPYDEDTLHSKFRVNSRGQLCTARKLEELPEPSPMDGPGPHPWLGIINWLKNNLSK